MIAWLPQGLIEACVREATDHFPLETGGTFMGWWADVGTVVITTTIGPGPNPSRGKHFFQPEQEWQLEQIAKHYEASGRRETYLGDWHSHPGTTTGHLSQADRSVLRSIINSSAARAKSPIMMIVHGKLGEWRATMWFARLRPRVILWPELVVSETKLREY